MPSCPSCGKHFPDTFKFLGDEKTGNVEWVCPGCNASYTSEEYLEQCLAPQDREKHRLRVVEPAIQLFREHGGELKQVAEQAKATVTSEEVKSFDTGEETSPETETAPSEPVEPVEDEPQENDQYERSGQQHTYRNSVWEPPLEPPPQPNDRYHHEGKWFTYQNENWTEEETTDTSAETEPIKEEPITPEEETVSSQVAQKHLCRSCFHAFHGSRRKATPSPTCKSKTCNCYGEAHDIYAVSWNNNNVAVKWAIDQLLLQHPDLSKQEIMVRALSESPTIAKLIKQFGATGIQSITHAPRQPRPRKLREFHHVVLEGNVIKLQE